MGSTRGLALGTYEWLDDYYWGDAEGRFARLIDDLDNSDNPFDPIVTPNAHQGWFDGWERADERVREDDHDHPDFDC